MPNDNINSRNSVTIRQEATRVGITGDLDKIM